MPKLKMAYARGCRTMATRAKVDPSRHTPKPYLVPRRVSPPTTHIYFNLCQFLISLNGLLGRRFYDPGTPNPPLPNPETLSETPFAPFQTPIWDTVGV